MRFLITALLLLISTNAHASAISGRAVVHDGDTIRINDTRIRLWGIDAPELKQYCDSTACGEHARIALQNAIAEHDVICTPNGTSYDRIVATCTVNGEDLGRLMTREGMALNVNYFSHGYYATDETSARHAKTGIWATNFENPATWRKRHR